MEKETVANSSDDKSLSNTTSQAMKTIAANSSECSSEQAQRKDPTSYLLKSISNFFTAIFKPSAGNESETIEEKTGMIENKKSTLGTSNEDDERIKRMFARGTEVMNRSIAELKEGLNAIVEDVHQKHMKDLQDVSDMMEKHTETVLGCLIYKQKYEEMQKKVALAEIQTQLLELEHEELTKSAMALKAATAEEQEKAAMYERLFRERGWRTSPSLWRREL